MPIDIVIRELESDGEARAAATIMANAEVWQRLGRTFENTYKAVSHPEIGRAHV